MVKNFQISYTAENFLDNQVDIIFKYEMRCTELVSLSVSQFVSYITYKSVKRHIESWFQ